MDWEPPVLQEEGGEWQRTQQTCEGQFVMTAYLGWSASWSPKFCEENRLQII